MCNLKEIEMLFISMITSVYDKCKTGSSEEQKEKTWKEINGSATEIKSSL